MQYFLKDEVINTILGNEKFKDYTSAIISAVIEVPYEEVYKNLQYKSNRINENIKLKNSITDNMYSLENDVVNIEINYNYSKETVNKNMRYLCHLLIDQVSPGEKDLYKNVIQININNYDFFKKGEFIYKSTLREEKYNIKRSELMEIYDINMDYLSKLSYNKIKGMTKSRLEKLLYIFVCDDEEKRGKICEGDVLMERVNDELYKLTEDGVLYYDLEEFHNRVARELGMNDGYKKGIKEGKKKGIEEGRKQGIEEGKKQGIEEGRIETLHQNIIGFYKNGVSVKTIAKCVNMSEEDVLSILKDAQK